jgi:hypothetical protein
MEIFGENCVGVSDTKNAGIIESDTGIRKSPRRVRNWNPKRIKNHSVRSDFMTKN